METEKSIKINLRIPKKLHQQIVLKASKDNLDFSKCCRQMLEKGVSVEAYKEDIDFLSQIISNELKTIIEPFGNRIIKILMKIGKASGGNMYANLKLLLTMINPQKAYTLKELYENSMKLGIEYMKKKDFEVDDYLTNIEKMVDDTERL